MSRRSLVTATTSAPTLLPESRDSARFSTTESEYTSRALSTWKSSAKTVRTIVEVKVNYVSFELKTAQDGPDSCWMRRGSLPVVCQA